MIMQYRIIFCMVVMSMSFFSYSASDQDEMLKMIASTPLEKELVNTGRYELFKAVYKLHHMLQLQDYSTLNKKIVPEFKKNAELELYLVFDDYRVTNLSDICMPWGRIHFFRSYTFKEKEIIASILRARLKLRHKSFFENFTCYQVLQIEDQPLPIQMERACEKERSVEDIKREWDVLNLMYKREQDRSWLHEYKEFYQSKSVEFQEIQGGN
jgi:hypothetical protein